MCCSRTPLNVRAEQQQQSLIPAPVSVKLWLTTCPPSARSFPRILQILANLGIHSACGHIHFSGLQGTDGGGAGYGAGPAAIHGAHSLCGAPCSVPLICGADTSQHSIPPTGSTVCHMLRSSIRLLRNGTWHFVGRLWNTTCGRADARSWRPHDTVPAFAAAGCSMALLSAGVRAGAAGEGLPLVAGHGAAKRWRMSETQFLIAAAVCRRCAGWRRWRAPTACSGAWGCTTCLSARLGRWSPACLLARCAIEGHRI